MRKILTYLLVFCMLALPLANIKAEAKQVVGQGGSVDSFNDFNTSVNIDVKVLDQSPRYAVDAEFSTMTITFSESLIWNVNTLEYEFSENYKVNNEFNIKVINHSDKPIGFSADGTAQNNVPINVSCTTDKNIWRIPGLQSGDSEKIRNIKITTTPTAGNDWIDVAKVVMNNTSSSVGSVVLTIRPEK